MPLPLIIAGGIAIAGGLAKTIGGFSQAKKYRQMMERYQRQELMNPYEHLKVSTLGAMLEQRNSAQNTATALYELRQSGANSIIGGTSRVVEQNNLAMQKVGAQLDMQQNKNEQWKAYGRGVVQNMQEKREEDDLAGFGSAMNQGRHLGWSGVSDMAQGAVTMAGGIGNKSGTSKFNPNTFSNQLKNLKDNPVNTDFSSQVNPSASSSSINWGEIGVNKATDRELRDIFLDYNSGWYK